MREEAPDVEPARILDVVGVRDRPPLARACGSSGGDAGERVARARDVALGAVRRAQVELIELLVERLVLAQRRG